MTPEAEKRAIRRFKIELPLNLNSPVQNVASVRDISSRGICFRTATQLEAGSELEFTLALPEEITLTEAIQVQCRGRVVRVEHEPGGMLSIAAQIDNYEFLSASHSA